jgi:hypothetical protein
MAATRLSLQEGRMAGPTIHPFGKASACAVVAAAVIYSSLWLSFGVPADPAYIAGRIFGWAVVPAIIVGIWAWRSSKKWSLARFIAIYVLILFVSLTLTIIGLLNNNSSP